jgi:hypothetical protein
MFETEALRHVLIGLIGALFIALVGVLIARAQPARAHVSGGRIVPDRPLIAGAVALALLLGGIALYAALTVPGSFPAHVIAGVALALGLATATGTSGYYAIDWDHAGLTGPGSLWRLPPANPPRIRIAWADVTDAGRDAMGNWYVADGAGRRIRWNWTYGGCGAFMEAVEAHCPWLSGRAAA